MLQGIHYENGQKNHPLLSMRPGIRRSTENDVPDWAGFSFVFKTWQLVPTGA